MTDETTPAPAEEPGAKPLSLLASEMFGTDYHGPKPEEADAEAATGEDAPPVDDTPSEAATEQETEETTDDTPESDTTLAEPGDEEVASTLAELIETNEWDPDWVATLKVPIKVDGTPAEASIADLVKSYQMGEAAERRLEDAKTKARAITEEAGKLKQAFEKQIAVAAKMIDRAEKALDDEASGIDWQKLREDDPAEYSARKADMAERRQALDAMKREAAAEVEESIAGQNEQLAQRQAEYIAEQNTLLLEAVPAWRDAETAKAEKAELVTYLLGKGFMKEDIMSASDHRLLVMARKAMLYDASQTKTAAAKKKVARVPKVLKPGTPKPQEQISAERVNKARQRLRSSGSVDDAVALLRAKRGAA